MTTFFLLGALLSAPPEPAWYASGNHPGWEAFGVPDGDQIDQPLRWRQAANRSVEYIRDGDPVPVGYVKIAERPADGDPYGFTAWLNATRAAHGLGAVAWDPAMADAAATNNSFQVIYGMGHHAMAGARRQNAAVMSYPALLYAWLASPGHRSALLDPTITHVGIAFAGAYCTFSGR